MSNNNRIRTVSLFSGAGGLDLGFEKAGYNILYATDFDKLCCETLRINRGGTLSSTLEVVEEDITVLDMSTLPDKVDMIIGGPPCQSFSATGRRAGGAAGTLDKRGNLFKSYCKVVDYLKPKVFLFENVRGILATNKGEDFRQIVRSFESIGYHIDYRILDAEDYGVPQQRERLFIVGHRTDNTFLFPRPLYGPDSVSNRPYVTVKESIEDIVLSEQEKVDTVFDGGKYASLLPLVPPGENYLHFTAKRGYPEPIFAYRSRFSDFLYKANPDAPVKTLIASPGKYTGPLHWDNRYLSVAEYKRIQGFPDDHIFCGDRASQIKQIGNSVCPKLAFYLAEAIKEQFFGAPITLELLKPDVVLSYDKRKGQKAKQTKAIHEKVVEVVKKSKDSMFSVTPFSAHVTPTTSKRKENMSVEVTEPSAVTIMVHCGSSEKIEAILDLHVFNDIAKSSSIALHVIVKGNQPSDVQTMWNAVDAWVKHSSHYNSLIELYGHFTEPHPIFQIDNFEIRTNLPSFQFAKHCMSFENCSRYFAKEHLINMWGDTFSKDSFISLARELRSYRFDIRCHETNIAIPQGVYMVAYPFSLPYDKQMNFVIKDPEYNYDKEA